MYNDSGKIQSFADLDAWTAGHRLVLSTYRTTKKFPKEEIFGLISQMRRCAVSITSNIAEGFSRRSAKEKSQFYSITQGSIAELQNQLLIARDIGYISDGEHADMIEQTIKVQKITHGLIKSSSRLPNT